MIKRAMITGLTSTGVNVADLRVLPAAVSRHLLKMEGYDAGVHVGDAPDRSGGACGSSSTSRPGSRSRPALQKEIEKHFTRGELRRVGFNEVGAITYPARVRESYATDLLDVPRRRGDPRTRTSGIVVDYGYSAASFVLPLVLGPLGVEAVAAHAFITERDEGGGGPAASSSGRRSGSWPRSAPTSASSSTAAAERLYLSTSRRRRSRSTGAAALPAADRLGRPGAGSSRSRSPSRAGSTSSSRAAGSRSSARRPRSPS